MPEEVMTNKGGMTWPLVNNIGWIAALGSALGIGIPALVKANDAEDREHRHRFDPETDVGFLQSKIYTDRRIGEQKDVIAAQATKIALLEQAGVYKDQIAALQQQNMYQYVNSTFVKGALLLPQTSIGQALPAEPPIQLQSVAATASASSNG